MFKVSVVVDNHPINEVHHTKFLGVIIDNKLKWKEHIDYISKKIAKGIGVIVKARKLWQSNLSVTVQLIDITISAIANIFGEMHTKHIYNNYMFYRTRLLGL